MIVLDGKFALGCGPGTDYPKIHIFQCMLERTDVITDDVLESVTFILAYRTVPISPGPSPTSHYFVACTRMTLLCIAYVLLSILSEIVCVLGSIVE